MIILSTIAVLQNYPPGCGKVGDEVQPHAFVDPSTDNQFNSPFYNGHSSYSGNIQCKWWFYARNGKVSKYLFYDILIQGSSMLFESG